jgi:hypothetical protein
MLISRKLKLLATLGVASVTLSSCSNTQMATTGLALVGTVLAVHTYNWVTNPDAATALDNSADNVFKSSQQTIKSNGVYSITSTTTGTKQSQIVAQANNKEVKVVVENIGNNQSKIYIKDGRGKDQAQILLQQIMKNVK